MNENLISIENENGSFVVQRFNVITTPVVVFNVWERDPGGIMGDHSSITRFDNEFDGWFGEVKSRRLPANINSIPVGDERFAAVGAWRSELERVSVQAIFQAFPHLATSRNEIRISSGEVEEIFPSVVQAEISVGHRR